MKKLLVWAVVLAAVAFGGKYLWESFQKKNRIDEVRRRVEGMLEAARSKDEQSAIGYWALGTPVLSDEELRRAMDAYADFARPLGLYEIGSWSCDPPVLAGPEEARVACRINGSAVAFRVVPRSRISLAR